MGQVNRLGKLPPCRGQEGTNGWPLHNLWLGWGQEDELGLSNGLAALPPPAPYPPGCKEEMTQPPFPREFSIHAKGPGSAT